MSNFCMLLMLASDEFVVWMADAGKSTIGGQILYLSNMVDERTIQKYEREAKEKNRESW
jgi:translation elongation factor EF-1alpha